MPDKASRCVAFADIGPEFRIASRAPYEARGGVVRQPPEGVVRYRAIVLNGQVATSSRRLRASLTRYVLRGGGLVAIHWAIDNFHDWQGFADVLGHSWQEGVSVEEHGSFHIVPSAGDNPILRGLSSWDTPIAEAIHYRLRGQAPIQVLATTRSLRSAEQAPVVLTHNYGRERTFFTPLGHSLAARADPNWQTLIVRATEWTATGTIAAAPADR